ncbi:uncharacterized protein N7473_008690 [Penicillium subrubescens]|uniref:MARVEL domain-containing protein n=1 Tax=Penicillium subrubescens TaxID=1316194 RepID=A0A1Q5U0D0_9EURO|nr:uncharacterized protein N7473_008690 [Penicillium subrubescens]KAJ5886016.1 hypothetical protein N7473_008690 [Penicillium subrubescens]OKP05924.1 hypothetical protein PENSUB_6644 [Penicillium subrubescens]
MIFSTAIARPLQLVTRTLQWSSAVIVMGLTSYFIKQGPKGQHLIYQEVIAVLSVAFFLPAFISPFLPTALSKFVLLIDVVFSYLWLTAFIFAAQDYNQHSCYFNAPPGITCSRKKANESFIFLAFIFTFFGMFLEVASLWAYRKETATAAPIAEKTQPGVRPPLDAPVEQNVPAGTV